MCLCSGFAALLTWLVCVYVSVFRICGIINVTSVCLCVCVQLIIFIVYVVIRKGQEEIPASMIAHAPRESPLIYQPPRRYEAWRFLTYMFIHHGSAHLLTYLLNLLHSSFVLVYDLLVTYSSAYWDCCLNALHCSLWLSIPFCFAVAI